MWPCCEPLEGQAFLSYLFFPPHQLLGVEVECELKNVNLTMPHMFTRWTLCLTILGWATVSLLFERIGNGDWTAWNYIISIIILGFYLTILLRDHLHVALTSFYQIFYYLGALASAALISGGTHMIEVNQWGTPNGLFWVLVIWFVAGMEATRIGYDFSGRVHLGQGIARLAPIMSRAVIFAVVGGVLAMAAYVFLVTGGPLLQDVDRVTFWRTLAPPGTSLLRSLVNQTFFFAAFYFLWQRRLKGGIFLPTIVIVGYILTALFVLGEKFSVFIIYAHAGLLLVPGFLPHIRIKMQHVSIAAAIFVAALSYVAFTYFLDNKSPSFIVTRIALQSQLLWSVLNDPTLSILPSEPLCHFRCDSFANGADYISKRYLPMALYNHYSAGGTSLSGFMPALSFLTFGVLVSGLLHLVISFILGFVQRKLVDSCESGSVIYSFLLFKTQFSLVMIWFAAMHTALPGLAVTLVLLFIFRVLLSKEIMSFVTGFRAKNAD